MALEIQVYSQRWLWKPLPMNAYKKLLGPTAGFKTATNTSSATPITLAWSWHTEKSWEITEFEIQGLSGASTVKFRYSTIKPAHTQALDKDAINIQKTKNMNES